MIKITTTAFIFHKNKILFVLHKKLNKWMHVGGHVKKNEFFDEALKREILEEVNLNVEIINLNLNLVSKPLKGMIFFKQPFFIHGIEKDGQKKISIDYICLAKEPIQIKLQSNELSDYKWLTLKDIDKLDTFDILKELTVKAFEEYRKLI